MHSQHAIVLIESTGSNKSGSKATVQARIAKLEQQLHDVEEKQKEVDAKLKSVPFFPLFPRISFYNNTAIHVQTRLLCFPKSYCGSKLVDLPSKMPRRHINLQEVGI